MIAIVVLVVGAVSGWVARLWWEEYHPRYIVIPHVSENGDNAAALQGAIDLASRLQGRVVSVKVPRGLTTQNEPLEFRSGGISLAGE